MINTLFVFRTPKGQNWREIDIEVTGDSPSAVTTNVLWANDKSEWNASFQDAATPPAPGGFQSREAFHTYAFEWTPTEIKWFIDDQPVRTKATGGIVAIPEMSAKIMMNLWIFNPSGGFGGDPSTNVYPMVAEYDWFRFYKWDGDTTYPCSGPPACLPEGDRDRSKNNPEDMINP